MIQIRNVPDALHRRLKARAALEGVSMSLFVLREVEKALARRSRAELIEATRTEDEMILDPGAAEVLREVRAERDRELDGRLPAEGS